MNVLKYFNPVATGFHSVNNFNNKLSLKDKFKTIVCVVVATLVSLPILGLGGLAAFRLCAERFSRNPPDNGTTKKAGAAGTEVLGRQSSAPAAPAPAPAPVPAPAPAPAPAVATTESESPAGESGSAAAAIAAGADEAPSASTVSNLNSSTLSDPVTKFWEDATGDVKFRRIMFLCLNMTQESESDSGSREVMPLDQKISLILNEYEGLKNIRFDAVQQKSLMKDLKANLGKEFDVNQTIDLPEGKMLKKFQTYGDGTCGFYSLFGRSIEGNIRLPLEEAKAKRKEFCEKLREAKRNNQVPESIKSVLVDYFDHIQFAPSNIRNLFNDKIDNLKQEMVGKTLEEKDNIKEKFILTDDFFEAYLKNLEKIDTYLLQDELQAVGEMFKINIVLHQPGWGNDAHIVASQELTSNYDGEVHHVWYNGHNHYEKAQVVESE